MIPSPRLLLAALLPALVACSEPTKPSPSPASTAAITPRPFPALPTSPEAARALIARETLRPPGPDPSIDAAAILAAMDRPEALVAGQAAVVRFVQAFLDRAPGDAFVLFGTFHDAAGQIDAFRRLVGPGGLAGLTVIAAEQFRADGTWASAALAAQKGDGAALDAFVLRGDAGALAALAAGHRDADYAAWKFGYEPEVLDLLVAARAAGVRFLGCDMPKPLLALAGPLPDDERNRLREIHCVHALAVFDGGSPGAAPGSAPRPPGPRRAALIWGQAHVGPGGIRRFLPPGAAALSVYAFGHRALDAAPESVEASLAKTLVLDDPVIVPLGEDAAALLLPDEAMGGRVDRVLGDVDAPRPGLSASATVPGVLTVGGARVELGRDPVDVPLAPGRYAYVFRGGGHRVLGSALILPGHRVEIGFDPAARLTSYVEQRRLGDP